MAKIGKVKGKLLQGLGMVLCLQTFCRLRGFERPGCVTTLNPEPYTLSPTPQTLKVVI